MRILRLAFIVLVGCGTSSETEPATENPRCELCGMRVEPDSGWNADAVEESGESLAFDTPKCLFRHAQTAHPIEEAHVIEYHVIEYYSQQRSAADELHYVLGSDVIGPMGHDLVPVRGATEAERFRIDHHGDRVITYDQVSRPIVDALFRAN